MARSVFFSFHFQNDFWRTQQVRNIGSIQGQTLCTANAWEEVKQKGNSAIEKWIDDSMVGKSCVIVLVGSETANRPWVQKEIVKGWDKGKGVLAIRIHKLLNAQAEAGTFGPNPLAKIKHGTSGKMLNTIAPTANPSGSNSKEVYADIQKNIESWIEQAIEIRKAN